MSARFLRGWLAVLALVAMAVIAMPAVAEDADPQWAWDEVPRVVAFADVHGAYDALEAALRSANVIDADLRWAAGPTHLVSTGDILDRGPESRKVLDLLMRLETEAEQAGGRVHVLLGNHEAMVLIGDRRYVSAEEYGAFASDEPAAIREADRRLFLRDKTNGKRKAERLARFEAQRPAGFYAYLDAFAPDGHYGRWLLQRNAMIRVNGVVFVHGGLPKIVAERGIAKINRQVTRELREMTQAQARLLEAGIFPRGASLNDQQQILGMLQQSSFDRDQQALSGDQGQDAATVLSLGQTLFFDALGPLWYRGTAKNPEEDEQATVDAVLEKAGARMAFVGHTPTEQRRVVTRFDGRVLLADTGMLASHYKGRASLAVFSNGKVEVSYPAEQRVEAPQPPRAPDALTDAEIETFLSTAEIIAIEDIGTGVTRPQRLTLRDDKRQGRASFKTVDEYYGNALNASALDRLDRNDSYKHEVAAYKLDRLIGLNIVPVTVLRKVEGKVGAVQQWIENAVTEEKRQAKALSAPDPAAFDRRVERLTMFDALIYNDDRNQGNVLFTLDDWNVHAIDHSRAFRTRVGRPKRLDDRTFSLPAAVIQQVEALDRDLLEQELGDYLNSPQIRGLLKRRDKLLKDLRAE